MRWIRKSAEPPSCLRDYLETQRPVGHGLDYDTFASTGAPGGGSRGGQLRRELTEEQCGLCAYTGAGIDSRLGRRQTPGGRLRFAAHNEHLKAQSVCRDELLRAGRTPGVDVGEDMNHQNIVAALLVSGHGKRVAKDQLFGASHRENRPLAILPTDASCEERLAFDLKGGVTATDPGDLAAVETIAVLNLASHTLTGWREQAIAVFYEGIESRADAERIVEISTTAVDGRLPEYSFAIRQVVQRHLNSRS